MKEPENAETDHSSRTDQIDDLPFATYPINHWDFLPKTLGKVFWDFWDGVGWWFLMNISIFFIGTLWWLFTRFLTAPLTQLSNSPLLIQMLITITQIGIVIIPVAAFSFSWMFPYAKGFSDYHEPDFKLPPKGLKNIKTYFLYCSLWYLINSVLIVNVFFYTGTLGNQSAFNQGFLKITGLILTGLFLWLIVIFNLLFLFHLPQIAEDKWTRKYMLTRALYITIAHKFFAFALFMMIALVWGLGIKMKLIGVALFCLSLTVIFINAAYDTLVKHYQLKEHLTKLEKQPQIQASTWKEKRELESKSVDKLLTSKAVTTRYTRTLRDLLKPWE